MCRREHLPANMRLWNCGTEKNSFGGLGVESGGTEVNVRLAEQIVGENALNQSYIDQLLIQEDGTDNKSSLGANATLGVSLAVARAAAKALRLPLYQYLGACMQVRMPVPG